MHTQHLVIAIFLSITLAAAGCSSELRVKAVDNLDTVFDFNDQADGMLHSPYVQGSQFGVVLSSMDHEEVQWNDYQIESSDPQVLQIEDDLNEEDDMSNDSGLFLTVTALKAGSARLLLRKDHGILNDEVFGTPHIIEVQAADHFSLHAYVPQGAENKLTESAVQNLVLPIQKYVGFLVTYWNGETQLHGSNALQLMSENNVRVDLQESGSGEWRDWVFVYLEGASGGSFSLAVGNVVQEYTVTQLNEGSISRIELFHFPGGSVAGQFKTVGAQAFASDGTPLNGVDFEWNVDGLLEPDVGEIFQYVYQPGGNKALTAANGLLSSESLSIEARDSDGVVSSGKRDNDGGCSAGAPTNPLFSLLLPLLWLLWLLLRPVARRRFSHRPTQRTLYL